MGNGKLPATIDEVRQWLATADDLHDVSRLHDLAAAAQRYADSHEAQNYAAEVKIRTARRGGELLRATGRAQGRRGAGLRTALDQSGLAPTTAKRWQSLAMIDGGAFEAWLAHIKANGDELTLAAALRKALGTHVQHNIGFEEWYTPAEIIDSARCVMGSIDLDPASSIEAQSKIRAKRFYTKEDNGLTKRWTGNVWLNPPYRQPLIQQFAEKLLAELDAKHVRGAVTLTNNATETEWGQSLLAKCSAACFPNGRVKFWSPGRVTAPLQGQVLCYFGGGVGAFTKEFTRYGVVMTG